MLHNSNLNEEKNGVLHFQQKAGAPYTQTYTRCRLVLSLIFPPQLGVCSQARAGLSAELSPAGNGKARDGYNTVCFSVLSYYNLAGYIVNYFVKNEQVPFIFQLHIFSSTVKINCRCCWQETFHKTFFLPASITRKIQAQVRVASCQKQLCQHSFLTLLDVPTFSRVLSGRQRISDLILQGLLSSVP